VQTPSLVAPVERKASILLPIAFFISKGIEQLVIAYRAKATQQHMLLRQLLHKGSCMMLPVQVSQHQYVPICYSLMAVTMCFVTSAEQARRATAAWVLLLPLLSQFLEGSMQDNCLDNAHTRLE
jgi:hypothetical protein